MMHPTSAKYGYEVARYNGPYTLSRDQLLAVLRREDELRSSATVVRPPLNARHTTTTTYKTTPAHARHATHIQTPSCLQQEQYSRTDVDHYLSHIRDVTISLQQQALREAAGVQEDQLYRALLELQSHRSRYADDEEVIKASVYGRYDVSEVGSLQEGDDFGPSLQEVPVLPLDEGATERPLGSFKKEGRPLVLIGMSIS